jgi:hypothetical protein
MKNTQMTRILNCLVLIVLITGVSSCTPENSEITEGFTPSPITTEISSETLVDETPLPTEEKGVVILTKSQNADSFVFSRTEETLESLTADHDLDLEIIENFSGEMLTPTTKIVVLVGEGLDPLDMAQSSPNVQFIVIDNPAVVPGMNVSLVGGSDDPQRIAFMAGYLAALISEDYKVSALVSTDVDSPDALVEAFVIGARFFCGICQPKFPPYNTFPRWETVDVADFSAGYQGAIDSLVAIGTEILYLEKSLITPEILTYLGESGVKVISNGEPDILVNHWVGTLNADPQAGLIDIWPSILAGTGGQQALINIVLMDMDSGLVSEGRYRLFEETVSNLKAGSISFESTP